MFNTKNIIILFIIYFLPKLVIKNNITSALNKDSCISRQQLDSAFNKFKEELDKETETNETDAKETANELAIDKESIKRVPTIRINESEIPVKINVTFYIDDINSISDVNMDFRLDFYYLQQWTVFDEDCDVYKNSLKLRNVSLENITVDNKVTISNDYFTLFWLPDIMIANAKSIKQQSETIDTRLLLMYFNEPENKIPCQMQYIARFESIVSCPMNFEDAPIDSQICVIQLRSFAFNDKKVNLSWAVDKIEQNPAIRLLEHELHIEKGVNSFELFNESYSTLEILMYFDRKLANKMVGVYTPSILIVLITFCTFWLGLNSTSERVTIGITALLALVTQFNDVRQSLPPTSYITEIDKWMIMCMIFVSAQMVQCTLVDHVYHHQQHNQKLKQTAMNVLKQFRRNSESKQKQRLLVPEFKRHEYNNSERVNPYPIHSFAKVLQKPNHRVMNNAFKKPVVEIREPNTGCFQWIIEKFWSLTSVPTSPDKPEYLPMKIDAYSRIIFPLFFATICVFYWPIMLMKVY